MRDDVRVGSTRPGAWRRGRCSTASIVVLALVTGLVAEPSGPTGAQTPRTAKPASGIDATVIAAPLARRATPGGQLAYLVTVVNLGTKATALEGAPEVVVTGIESTTVIAANTQMPETGLWQCAPEDAGLRCRLTDATGAGAGSLEPNGSSALIVTALVGAEPAQRTGIQATVSAAGDSVSDNDAAKATAQVVQRLSRPTRLFADLDLAGALERGTSATATLQLIDGGPGPVSSVNVAGLVPPGLTTNWSAVGDAWTCATGDDATPACSLASELAVGDSAPPLTISFTTSETARTRSWTTQVNATSGDTSLSQDIRNRVAVTPALVQLGVSAVFADDAQTRAGEEPTLDVEVANGGQSAPLGSVVASVELPSGVEFTDATGDFECVSPAEPKTATCVRTDTSTFEKDATASFSARLRVTESARPGARPVVVRVFTSAAAATGLGSAPHGVELARARTRLLVLPPPAPRLTATWWRVDSDGTAVEVTDGASAQLDARQPYTYELEVQNTGTGTLAPGSTLQLSQRIGKGVAVRTAGSAPGATAGWSCRGRAGLECTVHLADALPPGARLPHLRTTVLASRAATGIRRWPVDVKVARGVPAGSTTLTMPISIDTPTDGLNTSLTVVQPPTQGGTARLSLAVGNGGVFVARRVTVNVEVEGTHARSDRVPGWDCKVSGSHVRCRASASVESGASVDLPVAFDVPENAPGVVRVRADARSSTVSVVGRSQRRLTVADRLRVKARAAPKVVLTDPEGDASEPIVLLDAEKFGGGGLSLDYKWRQLCTKPVDTEAKPCRGARAPPVTWLDSEDGTAPGSPRVRALVPTVHRSTPLRFELEVSDGSGSATSVVTVRARPPTLSRSSFSLPKRPTTARRGGGEGALPDAKRDIGDSRLVAARVPQGPPDTTSPTTLAPPDTSVPDSTTTPPTSAPPTTLAPPPTVPPSTTTPPPTTTPDGGLPAGALLCRLLAAVGDGGAGPFQFAPAPGLTFGLAKVSVEGASQCDANTKIKFEGGTASLFGVFNVSNLSGSADVSGLAISSANVSVPKSWGDVSLTVTSGNDGKGLFLPFNGETPGAFSGKATANDLPFIPLPKGWKASTSITFGGAGDQSIQLAASATGTGSDRLTFTGSVGTNGSVSVTASTHGLIHLGRQDLDISGSLEATNSNTGPAFAISGQLDSPVKVVSGITLKTLQGKIAGTSVSGSGTVQLGANASTATTLDVALDYSDSNDWSLNVSSASQSWTPVPGLTIPAAGVTGSVKASEQDLVVDLAVKFPESWAPIPAVSLSKLSGSLKVKCPLAGSSCDPALEASGTVALTIAGATSSADVSLSFDLDSGKLDASANFRGSVGLKDKLELTGVALEVAYASGSGLSVTASATLDVLRLTPKVHLKFSSDGVLVVGELGEWRVDGHKVLENAAVVFSTYATKYTPTGGTEIDVPADGVVFAGKFVVPDWFDKLIRGSVDVAITAVATIDPAHNHYSLKVTIAAPEGRWQLVNAGKFTISITSVEFEFDVQDENVSVSLAGTAQLKLPASSDDKVGSTTLDLTLAVKVDLKHLSGTLSLAAPDGWKNAFGVPGLEFKDASFGIGIDFETATPSLTLSATAILPPAVANPLGIADGTVISVAASFSLESPCLGLEVGKKDSTSTVVDVGKLGVLTARYANIQIAPTGCTVDEKHTYPPGFTLDFTGALLGTSVDVHADLELNPFTLKTSVKVGEIHVGDLTIGASTLIFDIDPAKSELKIAFSGNVSLFRASVEVSGDFIEQSGTTVLDLHAAIKGDISIGFAKITKDPTVDIHIAIAPGQPPSIAIKAAGGMELLGTSANVDLDVALKDGDLEKAKGSVDVNSPLGPVTLNVHVNIDYEKGHDFTMSFGGTVTTSAGDLTNVSGSISPDVAALSGSFSLGSVVSATVSGSVAYGVNGKLPNRSGQATSANKGDFSFGAKPVALTLGGFKVQGSVSFGRVGSEQWAELGASMSISDSVTNDSLSVSGSFQRTDATITFDLTGTGKIDFFGFTSDFSLKVHSDGSTVTVNGQGAIDVLGERVMFAGDFSESDGTKLYTLRAHASATIDGFSLGALDFVLSNESKAGGMSAKVNLGVGSYVKVDGALVLYAPPPGSNKTRFYLSANGTVQVPGYTVNGTLTFTDCADADCGSTGPTTLSLDARAHFDTNAWFEVSGRFDANGSFDIKAAGSYHANDSVNFGVAKVRVDSKFNLKLEFESHTPYWALSTDDSLEVELWTPFSGWKNLFRVHVKVSNHPYKAYLDFHVGSPISKDITLHI